KPTPEMRQAMAEAEVGDDVFGEDPTVNRLEELAAGMLGTEAALFVASGTMANLASLLSHTERGDEVIVGRGSHIFVNEVAGAAASLGVPADQLAGGFDGVYICLSKGLGAPVGSLTCGRRDFIDRARKYRKMLGGGMRQAGIIAAAGIIALEKMTARLHEDHSTARHIAEGLHQLPGI